MSRGRQPLRAQDAAIPIAERRGLVMRYQHRRGNTCDFTIMISGLVAFVMVKRLDRLTSLPEDIVHDFSGALSLLRFIVSGPGISRELWLHTPHGAWRFFRVLDTGIVELDREGRVVAVNGTGPAPLPVPGMVVGKNPAAPVESVKKSGTNGRSAAGKDPAGSPLEAGVPAPGKVPEPVVLPENDVRSGKVPGLKEPAGPARDPGTVIGTGNHPRKNPEPEPDQLSASLPEKCGVLAPGPGPAGNPADPDKPGEIPAVIEKFLKRRVKDPGKDPGPG